MVMSVPLRRRYLIALAIELTASVSLAGCGALATGAAQAGGTVRHTSRAGSPGAAAAPAAPRFFADAVLFAEGSGPLQARKSATGALVAQDEHASGVTGLAAAGGRSFVIALPVSGTCATRLYRLRLSRLGLPGRLSPLARELHGELWSLATSASGQVIGYAVSGCAKGEPGYIGVIQVRGGWIRQWGNVNLGGVSPGNVALSGALSMSANGALIAFTGWDVAAGGQATRQVVRVLPASARPGTVAGRSRVVLSRPVTQPSLAAASLSPNGASFYLCTVSANRTRRLTKVVAYRTATGELREVIATLRGTPFLAGCPMGLDTTGRFLLVPYSLRSPHNPAGRAALLAARIDIATRATVILDLRLPANAGMDRYAGLRTAW
jgi:hypothetical protein